MKENNKHTYSLLGRFISLIFLILISISAYITWKIENKYKKEVENNLANIAYNIKQNIITNSPDKLPSRILANELDQIIHTNQYNQEIITYYAVFDKRNNLVITHSPQLDINNQEKVTKNLSQLISNKKEQILHVTKSASYVLFKLENSPFILLLGTNPITINYKDYFYNLLDYKLELLFLLTTILSLIYFFYKSILEPFLALSQAALDISNGNIDSAIPKTNSKEGTMVGNALEKIKNSLKTEKELVQEISKTRNSLSLVNLKLENNVANKTTELKKALEEKTLFINNLSHEVKTPLQSISHILENLVSNWPELNEEEKFNFSTQAAHSSQHLLSLVGNLLEIAKFSDGKIILDLKNTNLIEAIKEVVEECKMLYMNNKKIKIIVSNKDPVYTNIDRNRIKQVIRNLLLNAIKFSGNDAYISIAVSPTKILGQNSFMSDALQISIHDQGIGIPEDELSNIFSPFIQGANTKNKSIGTGLGLTICHEIISAHYGKIWAENNKDGGATFNISIPVTQPIELTNSISDSITLHNNGYNILMIDDEEICLNSMEMILYGTQYNLVKVKSAQFALEYLKENYKSISVIFIDLMMPDIYGLNLLSLIKEDPHLSLIPIILQTSSSDENEILKAFEKGVFSFITKPYKKNKLLEEIKRAIQFKELGTGEQPPSPLLPSMNNQNKTFTSTNL